MSTDVDVARSRSLRTLRILVVLVATGAALRLVFVDLLTKLTGTWIGGVESPRPSPDHGTADVGRA
jgi:hypothetical protein